MGGKPEMLRVFLSHASVDVGLARWVQSSCAGLGIGVYLFEDDRQPGSPIMEKLEARIVESDALFALLTPSAVESPTVQYEVGIADTRRVRVIPFLQTGTPLERLPYLQGREYIQFDPNDETKGLEGMLSYFRAVSERHNAQLVAARVAQAHAEGAREGFTNGLVTVGALVLAGLAIYYAGKQ